MASDSSAEARFSVHPRAPSPAGTEQKENRNDQGLKALAKRRAIFAILLALTIFGAVYGFAATLNVGANALSAGNAAVASCQATGTPTGTYALAYDATLPGYKVSSVTVTGMDPLCNGKTVSVTLTGAANRIVRDRGSAVYSSAGASTTVAIASLSAPECNGCHRRQRRGQRLVGGSYRRTFPRYGAPIVGAPTPHRS